MSTETGRRAPEAWAVELAAALDGELDLSPLAQRLYSQDASIYEQRPLGVARPRHAGDVAAIVRAAAAAGVPLIPRAGGTSLAGQCVGAGLVVDATRHMNALESLEPASRRARVQPGLVQDDLNDALAPHGLLFAPDTSTSRQAAIGGMIGNNSCGAYSVLFGSTRDHVLEIEAVLSDGSPVHFGPLDDAGLEAKKRLPSLEGAIYLEVCALVDAHRGGILAAWPKPAVRRRNTGYALDALAQGRPWNPAGPAFCLAPLLCGSEGTLAVVTAATLNLLPRPKHKRLLCAHFASVDEACRATLIVLEHRPAAVELMDGALLAATCQHREHAANRFWIQGEPGAILAIELWDDEPAVLETRVRAVVDDLRARGTGYAWPVLAGADAARVWAIRKAGLGFLTGIPGDAKPATAIEDTAVAVEDLPAYVHEMEALMARHGCACVYYGHASVGLIHFRPMLNLKDPREVARFEALMGDTVRLVKQFGGSLSGEHGDGRLRSPFLKEALSPEAYEWCVRIKRAFDPAGILNPGKIVDAAPLLSDLRTSPATPLPNVETEFDWSRTQGFVRAVEACNGAGFCRQSAGRGVMCPSYMATGEEAFSTRGRANVLRQLLTSNDPERAWTDPDLAATLDTCLSCKGCMTECPSGVDMARLKAEVTQKRIDRVGASLRTRIFAFYATLARLVRGAPRLASALADLGTGKRFLGIAPPRTVPAFARQTLAEWARNRAMANGSRGEVVLFNDEFTNYTEPGIGIAAIEFLEAAGYRVNLVSGLESGRTQLSKGFLRAARKRLVRAVSILEPFAGRGLPIIGLEPSAILTFRDEAVDLVPPEWRAAATSVKTRCRLFEEFVAEEAKTGAFAELRFLPLPGNEVLFHGHCHQKALAGTKCTLEALALIPELKITEVASGCCGMAGSFGYEAEHHELSMRIAEQILFPAIRARPNALLCAPGTSCRQQIRDGTGRPAHHPATLLRHALASPPPP